MVDGAETLFKTLVAWNHRKEGDLLEPELTLNMEVKDSFPWGLKKVENAVLVRTTAERK
jgi:hypothetical protein